MKAYFFHFFNDVRTKQYWFVLDSKARFFCSFVSSCILSVHLRSKSKAKLLKEKRRNLAAWPLIEPEEPRG